MAKSIPLYAKLALSITAFGLAIAVCLVILALWSSDHYHQEVTQQLHKDMAQYVLEHLPGPLFAPNSEGEEVANAGVLKAIAINTMMINPAVEVYLLDTDGTILGHALPESSVEVHDIDIAEVHHFLDPKTTGPVLGQNPRRLEQKNIFSVAPVTSEGGKMGYLYVVLASSQASSLAEQLSGSHVFRITVAAILGLIVFFGLSSYLSFRRITKPLQSLTRELRDYRLTTFNATDNNQKHQDEVAELANSFELMKQRIQEQFSQLSETDRIRRELISNVSHDLRTPLATMQGYLETLILKSDKLDKFKREQYIQVAHRHSQMLNQLISQLFELSKLDAGRVEPVCEAFSLTELLYDVKQDYELQAEQKSVDLAINAPQQNAMVNADISLIQRVLQNLMDNALRHTPDGGAVNIELQIRDEQVLIHVRDSGSGIKQEDLPFVFERFYQSNTRTHSVKGNKSGAGLGLSIVKKILELHGSFINVDSAPQMGTCFSFGLPKPA